MSTDDINTQTGTAGGSAGGATTNLTLDASLFANVAVPVPIGPRSFNDPEVGFGLKTTHEDCAIIMAERRDTTPDETTGDETTDDETTDAGTVLCGKPTTLSALVSVLHLGTSLKRSSWTP